MKPSLILLHGKARSGKDEVAKRLCEEYGYFKVGFADYLKELAINIFGWTQDEIYTNRTPKSRKFLQLLGTEIGRAKDPDFWVKKLEERLNESFFKGKNIVVSDVRFTNEAEWGKSKKGQLWKVIRPDVEKLIEATPEHASENDLEDWKDWNQIVFNHKTLEDLYKEVDRIMKQCEAPESKKNKEDYAVLLTDLIDVANSSGFLVEGLLLRELASGMEKMGWKKSNKLPERKWNR